MKPRSSFFRFLCLASVAVLFAGCWKDRVVWSPDRSRAAILTKEGLHLCDADGRLTPLLMPGVYRAAWLDDSQRLVLARSREIKDYATLAAALGPARTRLLAAKAETIWQRWQRSTKDEAVGPFLDDDQLGAVGVYLREFHGAEVRAKLAEDPKNDAKDFETLTAPWQSLVVARVRGDQLELEATLYEGLAGIHDVRPAPGKPAVAFVAQAELSLEPARGLRILLAPLDGSAAPVVVATQTGTNPDWTPDGRTLVYLKASGDNPATESLRLGALVEREVLDATGHIQLAEKTRDLAGLIFDNENRVRCLRDGRVLFDAGEFHLPLAGTDRPKHEQLFTLDRTQETPALTPLIARDHRDRAPAYLAPFEVSPEEKQVLFNAGADVAVLTLATGGVERLPLGVFNDASEKSPPQPVWRGPGELVYVKMGAARNELVLRREGKETVLSRTWTDEVLRQLIE